MTVVPSAARDWHLRGRGLRAPARPGADRAGGAAVKGRREEPVPPSLLSPPLLGRRNGLEERRPGPPGAAVAAARPGRAAHAPGTGRLLRVKATAAPSPSSLPSARGLRKVIRVAVTGGLRGEQGVLAEGV